MNRLKQLIQQIWNGQLPLHQAFWLAGALPAFILSVSAMIFIGFYIVDTENGSSGPMLLGLVIYLATLLYSPVAMVGIWRSSDHYKGDQVFAYAAKGAVIVAAYIYLNNVLVFMRF